MCDPVDNAPPSFLPFFVFYLSLLLLRVGGYFGSSVLFGRKGLDQTIDRGDRERRGIG